MVKPKLLGVLGGRSTSSPSRVYSHGDPVVMTRLFEIGSFL
jgi:hypothetical protein